MSKKSFVQDLLNVMSSRMLSLGLGLLTSIVTARYLGPEGNGIIASLIVYPSLFMAVGALGVQQATTYFVGRGKYKLDDIYNAILAIFLFTSVLCVVSSVLLINHFTTFTYPTLYVFLAVLPIPFSLFTTYTSGVYLGRQEISKFNRINWLPSLFNFLLVSLLIVVFSFGVPGAMIASFSSVFILACIVLFQIRKIVIIKINFNWNIIKVVLKLGMIYAFTTLIASLNYKVDIILLEKWSSQYEVGIYSKGATLVEMMWQIPSILSTLIFSRSANALDANAFSRQVTSLLRFSLCFLLFVAFGIFFISDYLIVLMYGQEFYPSSIVFKCLIPGVFIMVIYKILYMDIAGKGRPWMSMEVMIPSLFVNVILNYFLVPNYGAKGAAIASSISYSLAGISFLFIYSLYTKISLKNIFTFTEEDKNRILSLAEKFKKIL